MVGKCSVCGDVGYVPMLAEHTADGEWDMSGGIRIGSDMNELDLLKANPGLSKVMVECACLKQRLAKARLLELFRQGDVPHDFGRYTFEQFDDLPYAAQAVGYARQLVKGRIVDDGVGKPGLLLSGPPGTGKTTLAGAIAYTLLDNGIAVVWQDFNVLVRKLRRTYQRDYDGPDAENIVAEVSRADFLLLDDLGSLTRASRSTELWAEDAIEAVRHIASQRLNKSLPTVITTNLSKDQLYAQFGDRVVSRIRGLCHATMMVGPDFRAPGDRDASEA